MKKDPFVKLPWESVHCKSIDSVTDIDEAVRFPVEFLNIVSPPDVPLHNPDLKEGAPIMPLWSLDQLILRNSTRFSVPKISTTCN